MFVDLEDTNETLRPSLSPILYLLKEYRSNGATLRFRYRHPRFVCLTIIADRVPQLGHWWEQVAIVRLQNGFGGSYGIVLEDAAGNCNSVAPSHRAPRADVFQDSECKPWKLVPQWSRKGPKLALLVTNSRNFQADGPPCPQLERGNVHGAGTASRRHRYARRAVGDFNPSQLLAANGETRVSRRSTIAPNPVANALTVAAALVGAHAAGANDRHAPGAAPTRTSALPIHSVCVACAALIRFRCVTATEAKAEEEVGVGAQLS